MSERFMRNILVFLMFFTVTIVGCMPAYAGDKVDKMEAAACAANLYFLAGGTKGDLSKFLTHHAARFQDQADQTTFELAYIRVGTAWRRGELSLFTVFNVTDECLSKPLPEEGTQL